MDFTNWGTFIVWLVLLTDTFAIYFLIKKVKALVELEEQGTHVRTLIRKRVIELETKLNAILDEE